MRLATQICSLQDSTTYNTAQTSRHTAMGKARRLVLRPRLPKSPFHRTSQSLQRPARLGTAVNCRCAGGWRTVLGT